MVKKKLVMDYFSELGNQVAKFLQHRIQKT